MEVRNFTVVLEDSGDSGWGAYVPDLPGCTASGATIDDAWKAIQESIVLWIEHAKEAGEPIPRPAAQAKTLEIAV